MTKTTRLSIGSHPAPDRYSEKAARKYRKSLEAMVKESQRAVAYLDLIAKGTSDDKAGKGVASVCNALEFAADYHRHFTLGQSLKPRKAR